jgi:uncharacterized phage-associated protein
MSMTAMEVAKQLLYDGSVFKYNDITNLKLQKLLYFANITSISILNQPLFTDRVKAWKLGPAVGTVYYNYKQFENTPIIDSFRCTENNTLRQISEFVMSVFGCKAASELVNISHEDPVYKAARGKEDKIMFHTKQDATKVIRNEMKTICDRAAFASIKGKLCCESDTKLPPYVDDYPGKSNEEMKKIWGIYD